jgi:predicted enzyme related to lactoylglutathione lyase
MAKVMIDSWVMAGVSNMKRATSFYQKLGLKPSMKRPYYVEYLLPGGTALGLHVMSGSKRTGAGSRKGTRREENGWEIMLRVENLERLVADLKSKRIDCTPINRAPGGAYVSHIFDPDGNRLVLLEMEPPD